MATSHQSRLPGADPVCKCTHNPRAARYSVCPHVLRGSAIEVLGEPWPPRAPKPRVGLILCASCARLAASGDREMLDAVESLLSIQCAECVSYHLKEQIEAKGGFPL